MIRREISDRSLQVDALDGLRGLAALLVVFSHTSNLGWTFFPGLDLAGVGKSGVFLFFVLSTYLLTLPLLEKGGRIFSRGVMLHYWQRRFLRVYPLYTLYLVGVAALSMGTAPHWWRAGVGTLPVPLDGAGVVWHLLLQEGRGVTWSVAVEFKFYFLLPLFALGFAWLLRFGLSRVLAATAAGVLLAHWLWPPSASGVNDVRMLYYLPIFLVGAALAAWQHELRKSGELPAGLSRTLDVLGICALLLLCLTVPSLFSALLWEVPRNHFHRQFLGYAILWGAVLFAAVNGRGWIPRLFRSRPLRYFGMLSFSLYLLHPLVIQLLRALGVDSWANAWLVLGLTTALSHLSFVCVEGPCSRLRWGPAPAAASAGAEREPPR